MKKIIITSVFVITIIKIIFLTKQYFLLKSYEDIVVTNKKEVNILKTYILNSSDIKHQIFTRQEKNYFIIDRKDFSKYFPIFYKNGFKVAFLFPNSQCFLLSTHEYISNELLFCKNRINIEYYEIKNNESKIISEFQTEAGFWYYLTYRYL